MTTSNTGERLYRGPAPATAPDGSGSRLRDRGAAGRAAGGPARGRAAVARSPVPGWRDRAREAGAGAARWLAGDGGWPRFEAAGVRPDGGIPAADGGDLGRDLERWRTRVSRRRALVVARRRLLAAAAPALAAVSLVALAGDDTRSPWLLASLAGMLLAACAARRPRPVTLEQTARMLDRELGLRDRVGTALELSRDRGVAAAAQRHPSGLGALVAGEARAALAASFDAVRLRLPRAGAEWAALVALAAALGLLVALPAARHAGAPSRPAAATSRLSAGAHPASGSPARAGSHRAAARTRTALVSGGAAAQLGAGERRGPHLSAQQLEHDAAAAARNPATDVSGGRQPRPSTAVFRSGAEHTNAALPASSRPCRRAADRPAAASPPRTRCRAERSGSPRRRRP